MAIIAIFAANPPEWLSDLVTHLGEKGHLIRVQQDLPLLMKDGVPDVIFVTEEGAAQQVRHTMNGAALPHRPFVILLSNEITHHHMDVVLSPTPSGLEETLKLIVGLQHEVDVLRQNLETLKEENQRLSDEVAHYQKLSGHVEVLKNAIVRNVSHELRTPLLQVKSAVSLLADDVKDEKLISYATNATAKLEALVKNITMLGTSLDMNPGPVIVRDAVEYAKRNLRRVWEHRDSNERIQVKLEAGLPPVHADKQGLSTALQLLMDNALKFSKQSTDSIEVSACRDGSEVLIAVRDYGIGIAPEELERIFQLFYQVDSSSTRQYGGMGVGLAIVKLILDNHNTQIMVESTLGIGSTFSFKLPSVEM